MIVANNYFMNIQFVNQEVTLAGWVQTIRKFGAITFVDLRDRYGITQLLLGEALQAQLDAQPLGREFVLQAKGNVIERSRKNANIPTGEIEIVVRQYRISWNTGLINYRIVFLSSFIITLKRDGFNTIVFF